MITHHPLMAALLGKLTPVQIDRACKSSNIPKPTVTSWIKDRRAARIDLFCEFANAAGYEVLLVPRAAIAKENLMATRNQTKIVTRGKRIEVFRDNKLVAYVEDDTLFAIDAKGYASEVGPINHRSEISGKLDAWRARQAAA